MTKKNNLQSTSCDAPVGQIELSNLMPSQGLIINGVSVNGQSGYSLSGVGDVNQDGIDDFIIGAPGVAYVIFGSKNLFNNKTFDLTALNGVNGFTINGQFSGDKTGAAVDVAGDLNDDGINDLVIGAPSAVISGHGIGVSYVVFGGKELGKNGVLELTTLNGNNGFMIIGAAETNLLGCAVSGAGDLNGDGIDDLALGASKTNSGTGASYVIWGSKNIGNGGVLDLSSLNGVNGFVIPGIIVQGQNGNSVSGAGDLNHDGIDDLVIGAWNAFVSYVVFGGKNLGQGGTVNLASLNGANGFVIDSHGSTIGWSVAGVGDVNQDGIDDLALGAPFDNLHIGVSYVIFGTENLGNTGSFNLSSLNGGNGLVIQGGSSGEESGFFVSGVGDVSQDGVNDILIGASFSSPNGKTEAGVSYLLFGSKNLGSTGKINLASLGNQGFMMNGVSANDQSGYSGKHGGDFNGNGVIELLIGVLLCLSQRQIERRNQLSG